MHTFHNVPGYPNLMVNKLGEVLDKLKNFRSIQLSDELGYKCAFYTDENGKRCKARVHRLVALAFIPNPENLPIINHKDGDKANNHVSNLEWSSYQWNNQHAVYVGLKDDNVPCKVRNFYTKEVKEFPSLRLAKEYMGLDIKTDSRHLHGKTYGYLIKGTYEFKYAKDDSPWFYENRTEKVNTRFKFIIGDKVLYSLYELRDFLKVKPDTPLLKMLEMRPDIEMQLKNYAPKQGVQKKPGIKIKGVCVDNGAILIFDSIRKAAVKTKCDKRLIKEACDQDKTVTNVVTRLKWKFTKV